MLKKYKLSFDIWGLLLFLIVMIPNFIWFAVPAPNDILRADSITGTIDTAASVCQVLMVAALCVFRNVESKRLAFLFFAVDRKNRIAMIPISIFTICHLIYGVVNFVH